MSLIWFSHPLPIFPLYHSQAQEEDVYVLEGGYIVILGGKTEDSERLFGILILGEILPGQRIATCSFRYITVKDLFDA